MQRRCSLICEAILVFLLLFAVVPRTVLAVGEGDGGGGGPSVPLQMDWSYPANGEKNVSVTPIIQCKYSHNVAQSNVIKRNKTLFSITKLDGTKVDVNVYAADVQLEFDKRQNIYIEPIKPLEYDTTYIVTAKEGIQAKNSMATEKDQSFQFTTCGRRLNFNDTNVASMVQEEAKEQGNSPKKNQASKKTIKEENQKVEENASDAAVLSETPKDKSALVLGEKSANRRSVLSKTRIKPEKINSVLTICLAIGFLLILSIVVSVIKTKQQKLKIEKVLIKNSLVKD
jgi:hypothetical protein